MLICACSKMRSLGHICAHGYMCTYMGICAHIWVYLDIYGYIWTYMGHVEVWIWAEDEEADDDLCASDIFGPCLGHIRNIIRTYSGHA